MGISKKDTIANSALQVFAQYGYSDTTMDSIAEIARVAKGTLYYHFKTKEELFLYVNQKGVDLLVSSVKNAMQDENKSLFDRLIFLVDEHLRFFSEHSEFCLLLLSFSSGDVDRDNMIRSLLSGYFMTMEQFLTEMQKKGIIDAELDIRTLASAFFGMVGFTVLRKLYRNEPIYSKETRDTLIVLCKGIMCSSSNQ